MVLIWIYQSLRANIRTKVKQEIGEAFSLLTAVFTTTSSCLARGNCLDLYAPNVRVFVR